MNGFVLFKKIRVFDKPPRIPLQTLRDIIKSLL